MAIAHVQTVRTQTTSEVSSITHSNLAVGSGANRSLVAYVFFLDNGSSPQVNSIVFNTSENFTLRVRSRYDLGGGNYLSAEIWTRDNPTNTTANVVATLSEVISAGYGLALVISEYTGANNGVGTNTAAATGGSSQPTASFTTASTSNLALWGVAVYTSGSFEAEGGENERIEDLAGYTHYGVWDEAAAAGTSSITLADNEVYWSFAGIELKAASTGVTINCAAITLAGSVPVLDAVPGVVSPDMAVLTLAGSMPAVDAVPGAVSPDMNYVTLAGSVPVLDAVPGEVSPDMGYITLAGSAQTITVPVSQVVTMAAASLAGSAEALDSVPGEASPDMGYITLVGSIPVADVIPGEVSPDMGYITLAGSMPVASVVLGGATPQTVNMLAANVAGSVPALDAVPGEVSPDMGYITLAGSMPVMDIVPGATSVPVQPATVTGSAEGVDVQPGGVTVTPQAVTLAGSMPAADVVPGIVSAAMQVITLVGSVSGLTLVVDRIIAMASIVINGAAAVLSVVLGGEAPVTKRFLIWRKRFLR